MSRDGREEPGGLGRWKSKTLICLSQRQQKKAIVFGYEDMPTLSLLGSRPGISPPTCVD